MTDENVEFRIVAGGPEYRSITDALGELFDGNGTICLVVGYFTYNGYRSLRGDIERFLDRSPDNELVVVVGTASDQFSPRIARDLWDMDTDGQVELYRYPLGLHAKLYLRDGPDPRMILTSANLTQVAFRYNVELGVEIATHDRDHPYIEPFRRWAEELVASAKPLRRRDLFAPIQMKNTVVNWTNKGRLLPRQYVAKRIAKAAVLVVAFAFLIRFI